MNTITVAITLPINGTPLERAQALVAAMGQNPGLAAHAIGQLLSDMRTYVDVARGYTQYTDSRP